MVAIIYLSLHYFVQDGMILDDYEKYIHYNRFFETTQNVYFDKEILTLSFLDQMNLLSAHVKKETIIEFAEKYKENKVNLLQKGLQDNDSEVSHYSAATINMIENEYVNLILQFREKYNQTKEIRDLEKLIKALESYLESRLLVDNIFQVFNNQYIEALEELLKKQGKDTPLSILDKLVHANLISRRPLKALEYNNMLQEKYPGNFKGMANKLYAAYEMGDYKLLRNTIQEGETIRDAIPDQFKDVLAFWRSQGEIT